MTSVEVVHIFEAAPFHIRFNTNFDTGENLVWDAVKIVPGGESPHSDFERMLVSVIIGSKWIVFVQTLHKPLRVGTGGVNNKCFVSVGYHNYKL